MDSKNDIVSIDSAANITRSKANQKVLRDVKAKLFVVNKQKEEPGKSHSIPQDPFHTLAGTGDIIEPPFDLLTLSMLPEHCGEMTQCLDVLQTNIDGFGHRFICRVKNDPDVTVPVRIKREINIENTKLQNFFLYCTQESYTDFRKKLRVDLEVTGNAYFEILRNFSGGIQSFVHLPSYQMRLGRLDDEYQLVDKKILKLQVDGSVVVDTMKEYRRFRKYVQSKVVHRRNLSTIGGHKTSWFKEFGDPRNYDSETGELVGDDHPKDKLANEVVHFKIYSPRTPYGLPRYIGSLLSIYGDRAAEEINYTTFRNNNIPSMAILVSNGQLTEGSIDRIQDFVESQIQGSDNYSKFLLLEAEGLMEGEESGQHVKVEIKPLTEQQHKDALFQNYSKGNQDKVRRVWRLPPIFVGRTDEYTRTTAEASRVLADEQIFSPERSTFDDFINRIIFPEMGIVYHKYRSNSPNTTDNQQLVKILSGSEKTGGITPRIAREILEDILSKELPAFPKDFPADTPFSLTMAEAVKNKADPAEPGQQVTALKVKYESAEQLVETIKNIAAWRAYVEDEFEKAIEKDLSIEI